VHASTRQPHARVGYAAIPNAISIVQDENQLTGAERLGLMHFHFALSRLAGGTAGGNEKASGPCRAIEIVVVMRLTTSSARLESNPRERNSVLVNPRDEEQKPVIVRNLNRGWFRARRT
jgi:hypothetical protein